MPFTLLALLVLAVAQLPVAIWLVRRTAAAQQDRDRMLETVLVASERERRLLARHLHDGVVQELAGAAFLLTARGSGPEVPAGTRQVVGVATETLHRAVGDLREMLVELHPRELTGDNLADLVATSAIRACPDQKVAVTAAGAAAAHAGGGGVPLPVRAGVRAQRGQARGCRLGGHHRWTATRLGSGWWSGTTGSASHRARWTAATVTSGWCCCATRRPIWAGR